MHTRHGGGAASEEGVEDEVIFAGRGVEDAFEEGDGFLCGMFAEDFFVLAGREDFSPDEVFVFLHELDFFIAVRGFEITAPDGFHLLASRISAHFLVIEEVLAFFGLSRP